MWKLRTGLVSAARVWDLFSSWKQIKNATSIEISHTVTWLDFCFKIAKPQSLTQIISNCSQRKRPNPGIDRTAKSIHWNWTGKTMRLLQLAQPQTFGWSGKTETWNTCPDISSYHMIPSIRSTWPSESPHSTNTFAKNIFWESTNSESIDWNCVIFGSSLRHRWIISLSHQTTSHLNALNVSIFQSSGGTGIPQVAIDEPCMVRLLATVPTRINSRSMASVRDRNSCELRFFELHRHRPQIAFPGRQMKSYEGRGRRRRTQKATLGDKWKAMKGNKWRETLKAAAAANTTAAQNREHEGRELKGDKAAAKSSPEWRSSRETTWRGTRRQRQPRAGQNGDHEGRLNEGRQGGSGSQWRSGRGTNEGRQGGSGITTIWRLWGQQPCLWEIKTPIASSSLGNEGRQGGSGSQEQARMEIMKGNKWRETRRHRQPRAGQNGDHEGRLNEGRQGGSGSQWRSGRKWRETNEEAGILEISMQGDKWRGRDFGNQHAGRQMKGDKCRGRSGSDFGNQHAGRQMKGDKWRRETRSGSDFGNQQPNLWEVRTPIASSYLGNKFIKQVEWLRGVGGLDLDAITEPPYQRPKIERHEYTPKGSSRMHDSSHCVI